MIYRHFQPGMTVHCRVLSVNAEKFSVDLSCRSSDLIDKQGKFGYAIIIHLK